MSCGEVRGKRSAAERNGVAIVEDAVYLGLRKPHGFVGAVMEVFAAAGLDDWDVLRHNFVFRAGFSLDLRTAGTVVKVAVADEEDLRIAVFEAEGLDGLFDLRRRRR